MDTPLARPSDLHTVEASFYSEDRFVFLFPNYKLYFKNEQKKEKHTDIISFACRVSHTNPKGSDKRKCKY